MNNAILSLWDRLWQERRRRLPCCPKRRQEPNHKTLGDQCIILWCGYFSFFKRHEERSLATKKAGQVS